MSLTLQVEWCDCTGQRHRDKKLSPLIRGCLTLLFSLAFSSSYQQEELLFRATRIWRKCVVNLILKRTESSDNEPCLDKARARTGLVRYAAALYYRLDKFMAPRLLFLSFLHLHPSSYQGSQIGKKRGSASIMNAAHHSDEVPPNNHPFPGNLSTALGPPPHLPRPRWQ